MTGCEVSAWRKCAGGGNLRAAERAGGADRSSRHRPRTARLLGRAAAALPGEGSVPKPRSSAPHQREAALRRRRAPRPRWWLRLANSSFFQNGALVLSQSIRKPVASSAAWRCDAAASTSTMFSPATRRPTRWITVQPQQVPAAFGLFGDARDGALGHRRIVLERHCDDRVARVRPHRADEAADAADVGASGDQRGELRADVEVRRLHADPGHDVSLR